MEPFVVVTMIGPDAAVAGILKVSVVGETVVKAVTVPPPIVTVGFGDFSFKPAPLTVTAAPGTPRFGEKL